MDPEKELFILNIETSGDLCAVAVGNGEGILAKKELFEKNIHSKMLAELVSGCLKQVDINAKRLSAVAISLGPGSFTGLRIGMSLVKGMAFAADIPIIGISTLKLLALSGLDKFPNSRFLAAIIDARRNEFFFSQFSNKKKVIEEEIKPEIIDADEIIAKILPGTGIFTNQLNETFKEKLENLPGCHFCLISTSMDAMNKEAILSLEKGKFCDLDSVEPLYLRTFAGVL